MDQEAIAQSAEASVHEATPHSAEASLEAKNDIQGFREVQAKVTHLRSHHFSSKNTKSACIASLKTML